MQQTRHARCTPAGPWACLGRWSLSQAGHRWEQHPWPCLQHRLPHPLPCPTGWTLQATALVVPCNDHVAPQCGWLPKPSQYMHSVACIEFAGHDCNVQFDSAAGMRSNNLAHVSASTEKQQSLAVASSAPKGPASAGPAIKETAATPAISEAPAVKPHHMTEPGISTPKATPQCLADVARAGEGSVGSVLSTPVRARRVLAHAMKRHRQLLRQCVASCNKHLKTGACQHRSCRLCDWSSPHQLTSCSWHGLPPAYTDMSGQVPGTHN